VYGQCAEVKAIYQKTRGFSALKATTQDKARELVDALLRQLVSKEKAVRRGCTAGFASAFIPRACTYAAM
jgi:hypothetical protein